MNIQTVKAYRSPQINNEIVCYELVYENGSSISVPLDPANKDYQAIQEWIAEGNTVIDNGAGQ
jgi:hypothetical protein